MSCVFGDQCPYCKRKGSKAMDPNTCLAEIRELTKKLAECQSSFDASELGFDLAEKFEALDRWLTHEGGFLPADWTPARTNHMRCDFDCDGCHRE